MCLNSGGNDNVQFFFKNFLEGGKMTKGENDRGYYGNYKIYLMQNYYKINIYN